MRLKTSMLVLLLAMPLGLFAQSIELRGTVKDSIGNPLELANIIATNKAEGTLESYGITDAQGRYKLELAVNTTYELKVSFLGLKSEIVDYTVSENAQDDTKDFVLVSDPNQLDNVELVYEMPVSVKGDTIVYNTDSFTNGNEKKLGDVLKKLPGVEVTDEGEIEVDGQKVSKVMIEGKDFFDGDSKLATQNIPADALKKVEVLKNYNEVSQMRGLGNDQDNIAINLKLKEGKKNFWFGDITTGGGVGDDAFRYTVKPKLFYYSPKGSINIIGNFNNTGEVPFTFRDYFNFTGGFRGFNQRGGTSFNISDGGLGFLTTQNNRANEIESDFIGANFTYSPSKTWDLSGFTILNDGRTNFINNSLNTFINGGVSQEFNEVSDQRNQLGMVKFSAVHKPSTNLQVDYDVLAKLSKQTEFSDGTSIERFTDPDGNFVEQIDNVDQSKENSPFSINQNLNVYYTLNENNIFAATAQHLFQEEDPFYNALVSQQPFQSVLPLTTEGQDLFNVNQDKTIRSNKLDAKIDYYYVINNKSNINLTFGSTLSRQDFNSNIFQILENNGREDFENSLPDPETGEVASLGNDVQFNFSDWFLGAHYKFKTGIYTFTPGLTLHRYGIKSDQAGSVTEDNQWLVLPDFFAIAQFAQSKRLQLNYQVTAQYTDVSNYAEGLVFNNFNRLFRGNRNLENALFHNVNLNYFSFSMFNFTSIFGGVNYSRRIDPVKTAGVFQGIDQISSPINNTNFVDETYGGNARFSKTFKKFKWNVRGNVSWSDLNNVINGQDRNTKNFTQNYQTSLETNFKEAPNFEIGYNYTSTRSDNGFTDRTFVTNRPFANMEVNFLKGFTFAADWSYYDYDDNDDSTDLSNTYQFLEANLYYQKPESKWEFRVQATNLLDVDVISNNNVNDILISNTEYFVQPRYVIFTVKYNL
ncbi:carboxypeptidase-like regulatory domain-containing protein [uncultured Dokdonia sp.]|uniref:carboxypeptidase-like regulatory domain-containing protein n=1 Tax=uncultured Dokdonia sp. TaxID=575653 RepID=UPI00262981B3|nr:carboxypeptidase-like regulatory domain-containing protein [uncultured Dokdonia sp.]